MSIQKMLGGLKIIFESESEQKDKHKVVMESTYLIDARAIGNIEVKITKLDGSCVQLKVMDWESFVDEEYFEEEEDEK